MKYLLLFSLILIAGCNFQKEKPSEEMKDPKVTTYYFIRHAEKDTLNPENKDPELTEEGVERAQKWAEVFRDVEFDLIFSSNYKRTLNTAKPIADSQAKEIDFYNTEKLNDEDFQQKTKGKTVLVVGHSNLNPEFVNYIIEQEKYEDLDEKEYGSLFIAVIHPDGTRTSEVLYFN
ncbi:phosphoglycerate mutase family protein [Salegentibacter sediminis]|uniref:phosphoglycerate mutase family protein n=1 Tax=Salegentibacter sediminis TaxID=1930251 RepID=UPI0009C079B1|nr:phosphoglycerate mutase family protein [Salegentibacter sediminis]